MSIIMDKLRKATKDKVKDIKEFFVMNDPDQSGTVRYESFRYANEFRILSNSR